MFACLGREGGEFLAPNPLIDGVNWVGQASLKGGVCRVTSALSCLLSDRSLHSGGPEKLYY